MARLTLYATAGQDVAAYAAEQELVATFEAALAVLVADGASPTQAHVTTANNAYTSLKAVWTRDLVVDYDRATINTDNLKNQAIRAILQQMLNVR
jgi:hypothetical protein